MDKKIYAKTAGEPIRIKVKSDSSVLYGKTEEIIEEKYCNVSVTVPANGYPELYRRLYEVINSGNLGKLIGEVYNGTTKTFSLKENICIAFPTMNMWLIPTNFSSNIKEIIEPTTRRHYYQILGDCSFEVEGSKCFTPDTLITLSDHTQKRIDQLSLSDKVLSYNPKTQKLEEDEITYTDSKEDKEFTEYDIWTFEGGYEVKTVYRHRFYNIERQAMVYMDEWKLGEHAYTLDGKEIALLSHKNIKEKTKHYTLFTKNQNYFANGLLSGNRYTEQLNLGGNE